MSNTERRGSARRKFLVSVGVLGLLAFLAYRYCPDMQDKIKGLLNKVQENSGGNNTSGNNVSEGQNGIGNEGEEVVFTPIELPKREIEMAQPYITIPYSTKKTGGNSIYMNAQIVNIGSGPVLSGVIEVYGLRREYLGREEEFYKKEWRKHASLLEKRDFILYQSQKMDFSFAYSKSDYAINPSKVIIIIAYDKLLDYFDYDITKEDELNRHFVLFGV